MSRLRTNQLASAAFGLLASVLQAIATSTPNATNTGQGQLLFATVLYRHGDRSPIQPYPTDLYASTEFWPSGWGQLTNSGKQQHLELGKWLRHRYLGSVLRHRYHRDDIYIESTDFDRTLMSAAINSAALFPVEEAADAWDTKGSLGSVWQPIPVHTTPVELDERLWCGRPCPAYAHQLEEVRRQDLLHLNTEHAQLMRYLRLHSGSPLLRIIDIALLHDTLEVQKANGLALPDWTKPVFPHGVLRNATLHAYTSQSRRPLMARLKFGWLLLEILQRFRDKAEGRLRPTRRSMWVYSAHDLTVSGMLNTLGMFDRQFPQYAAALLFELRRIGDEVFVQIFYRNTTTREPQPLEIPKCGKLCALERMFRLYQPVLPTGSWQQECQWPPADGLPLVEGSTNLRGSASNVAAFGFLIQFAIIVIHFTTM